MFVEYIYEQYNPETARRNTPKLKHSIPIEKTKHLPKRNWQPWFPEAVFNVLPMESLLVEEEVWSR